MSIRKEREKLLRREEGKRHVGIFRKQKIRFQGFVVALLGAFLLFLGLPQVGTLHHHHPGDDHFHIHPELVVSPPSPSHLDAHNQQHTSAHSRAHVHSHPHSHHRHAHYHHEPERPVVAHHSPRRYHHGTLIPKTTTRAFAYENLVSAEKGHWHLRITLHHASSPYGVFGLSLPLALSFQTSTPSFLFTTPSLTHHSRAPPQLS